jgi:hypothetical protein
LNLQAGAGVTAPAPGGQEQRRAGAGFLSNHSSNRVAKGCGVTVPPPEERARTKPT